MGGEGEWHKAGGKKQSGGGRHVYRCVSRRSACVISFLVPPKPHPLGAILPGHR